MNFDWDLVNQAGEFLAGAASIGWEAAITYIIAKGVVLLLAGIFLAIIWRKVFNEIGLFGLDGGAFPINLALGAGTICLITVGILRLIAYKWYAIMMVINVMKGNAMGT